MFWPFVNKGIPALSDVDVVSGKEEYGRIWTLGESGGCLVAVGWLSFLGLFIPPRAPPLPSTTDGPIPAKASVVIEMHFDKCCARASEPLTQ